VLIADWPPAAKERPSQPVKFELPEQNWQVAGDFKTVALLDFPDPELAPRPVSQE
jgi:hypothetical protein